MSEFVKVHFKNGKVHEVPKSNLSNVKRMFFTQIAFVEEEEQAPIISKPIIKEVKIPKVLEPAKVDTAPEEKISMQMNLSKLRDICTKKGIQFEESETKKELYIKLIN